MVETAIVNNANEWVVSDWLDELIAEGKLDELRIITRHDVLTLLRRLQETVQQSHPDLFSN